MAAVAVLDDRLLIEELLVGLPHGREELHTTTYWYYRACRAAVLGAGGHLSGPFARVDADRQAAAIISLLELRDDISLPDPRSTVPEMARLASGRPLASAATPSPSEGSAVLSVFVSWSSAAPKGPVPSSSSGSTGNPRGRATVSVRSAKRVTTAREPSIERSTRMRKRSRPTVSMIVLPPVMVRRSHDKEASWIAERADRGPRPRAAPLGAAERARGATLASAP